MGSIRKSITIFLLSLLSLTVFLPAQVTAGTEPREELNYVALGDSLAAGFLNDPPFTIGKGYPVFIKEGIESDTSYNIQLVNAGVGGYTTENVLAQVTSDANVIEAIKNADLITLDIGANDLLGAVDIEGIDPEDPASIAEAIENATETLSLVTRNMNGILNEIRTLNKDASIYVMGYYNALHYLDSDTLQGIVITVMGYLNDIIATSADKYDSYYVPTFDAFEGKYEEYLPKPDIHPNEAGYEVIANLFLDKIIPNLPPIEEQDSEPPVITVLGDNPMKLEVGDEYIELGATAEDNIDGDLSDSIEISGEVNADVPGEFVITYTVTDEAGNKATATRKVIVKEAEKPGKPGKPGEPGKPDRPGDLGKGSIKGDKVSSGGGELPKTATSNHLMILIGFLTTISGGVLLFIRRQVGLNSFD